MGDEHSFEQIDRFRDDSNRLFGSYVQFCQQTGRSPKTVNTLSAGLLNILMDVLGWPVGCRRKRISDSEKPHGFFGIRFKAPGALTISETLGKDLDRHG